MRPHSLALLLLMVSSAFGHAAPAPNLNAFTYRQKPGSQLPLTEILRDETGRSVQLSELLDGKPLILALVYFHCPNLCGIVRADLFNALAETGMAAGRDYTLVALSIDPSETDADATAAKAEDLSRYSLPGAEQGWHFLTGPANAVRAVADAVGFRDRFDPELKQFIHPAGIVFATPKGIVSSYLLGVGYRPTDIRLAVTRADRGTVAAASLPILLLCYHYDPATGRYTLAIIKLLRLAAGITVVTVGGTLFLAFRRERRDG
ncbi:MAG TPA: SCO family protein [Stellaceae bacterium]|nr:SCO family protein [Stellaceae bacterium]